MNEGKIIVDNVNEILSRLPAAVGVPGWFFGWISSVGTSIVTSDVSCARLDWYTGYD